MRIAVDAMGGDFAPQAIVEGALLAVKECAAIDCLYLVGDETAIRAEIARCGGNPGRVEIRHASEVVGMGESPATAVRRKKDSSINRSMDLVKNGEADAVFAAGSTGAAVAAATLKMRTLEGIRRPGIAVAMPTPADKPVLVIDGGATTDCTPEILMQFAVMGDAYSRKVIGRSEPKVGLMSVGTEEAKGNALSKEAFELLERAPVKFIGNVEGHDLFEGEVDVVVCDGFTGNVILKTSESVAHAIGKWLKRELTRNPIRVLGALLLSGGLRALKRKTSQKTYGGAPLLGVNGICIIGHGSSDKIAAKNGILQAVRAVELRVNEAILEGVRKCAPSAGLEGTAT
ncbi:MAG TPA: phosphate acyltransferase PlsX [Kiritimatiellia bacterium]|nr:phosphate acyltransferase PlsX [Kiritimatiellia bacterium]